MVIVLLFIDTKFWNLFQICILPQSRQNTGNTSQYNAVQHIVIINIAAKVSLRTEHFIAEMLY